MRCLALICLLICSALPALSKDKTAVDIGISTLGTYVAPSAQIAPNLQLRTPLYVGRLNRQITHDGNRLDSQLSVTSGHVMADYFFGPSGLHLSAGIALGGYELTGTAVNPTLDGTSYPGQFDFLVEQDRRVTPVAAVGYRRETGSGWGISAEFGARFSQLELSTSGQETLGTSQRNSFEQDIDDLNRELSELPVIPFASLGLVMNF
jgi:hypothetical protein